MLPHPPPPLDYIRKTQIIPVTGCTQAPDDFVRASLPERARTGLAAVRQVILRPISPPPLDYIRKIQIVPVTVSTLTPGVTVHAPVVEFWTYVAAGTVICPGTVAKAPVAAS